MTRRLLTPGFIVVHVIALHALVIWFSGPGAAMAPGDEESAAFEATPEPDPMPAEALALVQPTAGSEQFALPDARPGGLDLANIYEDDGQMLAALGGDWTAELTTDVELQKAATTALNRAKVPFGAVVVIDVKTGEVLALADRYDETHEVAPELSRDGPPHIALRAIAPAASVFKIITATGLLEKGVRPAAKHAYKGAKRRIYKAHLEAPGRGANTAHLGDALAKSNNGYFARLSHEKLEREELDSLVRRFGFNQVLPFPLLIEASTARVPRNALERARMAAGFWHSRLTPLHGALIAAAIAGDGSLPTPRLVRAIRGPDGRTVQAPKRPPIVQAIQPDHARAMRKMMARTVRVGSARRSFRKWPKVLSHITVGGKTGTLAKNDPYTFYTWFVGYAPVDDPQVAIAVMVGNGTKWWQRGSDVAREVLIAHFKTQLSPEQQKKVGPYWSR